MSFKILAFSPFKLVGIFALGFVVSFSNPTLAETVDPEHEKHLQQDPTTHQKSSGPLAPLQKAIERNSTKSLKKPPSQKIAQPQDSMNNNKNMAPPTSSAGMGGGGMMGMMSQMMGQMMPPMPSTEMPKASAQVSSELPGFAGASHIYHIGATGFFLDHAEMVKFNSTQVESINRIREKSFLMQKETDRKIVRAEEELWKLTASDKPVIKVIENKVREIESLKGEKRINFIRQVGEAAQVLTLEQRSILLGKENPQSQEKAAPGSMGDM